MLDATKQDLRYAVRSLGKRPGFTAAVVATLAIGIGANAAVFTVLNSVLLRPLPYEEPDALVSLWTRYLPSSGLDIPRFPLSAPEVMDYREGSETLEEVVPYRTTEMSITGTEGEPARLAVGQVGRGLFDLLGVEAARGRTFVGEEQGPGGPPAAVLSHRLWRGRFGGDPDIVDREVTLDGRRTRVVGIMPEGFAFPSDRVEAWVPLGLDAASASPRAAHYLLALGRLAPGASLARARSEAETIRSAWNEEFEHHAMGHYVFLTPLREDLVGDVAPLLWLLTAAVALVLLIACANVANLLLARGEGRGREMSVRAALGAGRGRLVRQLLTESILLSSAGGALGLLLAAWTVRAVTAVDPDAIPRLETVAVDGTVLLVTAALVLATAVLFGLAPALRTTAAPARGLVSESRAGTDPSRRRFRAVLVAAEVAVSVIVVVAAGLVGRSLWHLTRVDPGVDAGGVLTFQLSLPETRFETAEAVPRAYAGLLERIRSLPGVTAASAASDLPLGETPPRVDFRAEGEAEPPPGAPAWHADLITVHPGYFRTLGIPVLRGRAPAETDREGRELVALVNRAAARRLWEGEDPVGRRIAYPVSGDEPRWIRIVGVVGDTKVEGLDEEARPQVYLPHAQLREAQGSVGRSLEFVVRTSGAPRAAVPAVRGAVAELDPALPLADLRTLEDVVAASVARPRLTANLMGSFGIVALLLAVIGVYGVVSYAVASRTREIGIRMALGADRGRVLKLVLRQGMGPVLAGGGAGLLLSAAAAGSVPRLFEDVPIDELLFGVSPTDPITYAGITALLLGAALLACWLPARRATCVDPASSLRWE